MATPDSTTPISSETPSVFSKLKRKLEPGEDGADAKKVRTGNYVSIRFYDLEGHFTSDAFAVGKIETECKSECKSEEGASIHAKETVTYFANPSPTSLDNQLACNEVDLDLKRTWDEQTEEDKEILALQLSNDELSDTQAVLSPRVQTPVDGSRGCYAIYYGNESPSFGLNRSSPLPSKGFIMQMQKLNPTPVFDSLNVPIVLKGLNVYILILINFIES